MRISILLESHGKVLLPIQYNHILQGFLYNNLSDKDYREFLHQSGYSDGKRIFRLFTYSRLQGNFRMKKESGQISFESPMEIVISSAVEQFITDLAETLIKSDNNFLGPNPIEIKSINVHKNIHFQDEVKIKMLSPVVAYTTLTNHDKKYTQYISPWQKQFDSLVANNLLAKHRILYGSEPANKEFKVIPVGNQEQRMKKLLNYKGTVIKGYAGIYWLKGNPDLIRIAYDTGLGSKNSQGFGCWEMVG